jgi:methanol metabolism-related c-type cytochrome
MSRAARTSGAIAGWAVGALVAAAAHGVMAQQEEQQQTPAAPSWEEQPYIQQNDAFDYGVYNGFRRYHAYCHTCHGPDALGSSFAPALLDSMQNLDYAEFLDVVVNGRENVGTGQQNVMPAFGLVSDVMLYIDHIYAYLKARADGELSRGRPQRLPPEEDPVWQDYQAQQG